jgi:hypothetical protein
MAVKTLGDVLRGDAAVTALVPAARITPLLRPQAITVPAITLQRIDTTPQNHLRGWAQLDASDVQIDIWAATYAACKAIAAACQAAINTAGYIRTAEYDNTDADVDPVLYRITQSYLVWTT